MKYSQPEGTQPNIRNLVSILFKRRKTILLFLVSTVFLVSAGTFSVKPQYETKAQILVKIGRENLYTPPNDANSYLMKFSHEDLISPEIELLKSRGLIQEVIARIGVQNIYDTTLKKTVSRLQKALEIKGNKNSNVITIFFRHPDPQTASKVVNTLVSVYRDQHLKVHQNPHSYDFFEEQTEILKTKLETSENKLSRFKTDYNLTVIEEDQRLLLNQVTELQNAINVVSGEEAEAANRISHIQVQLKSIPETILQEEEVDHNPLLIGNLEEKLVELELKENELLTKYTKDSVLVQNVSSEIKVVKKKLSEHRNKRYGISHTGTNLTYQRLNDELYQNIINQEALKAKKAVQTTQLSELQKKLDQLNKIEVEYSRLKQLVDVERQNYMLYLSKFEEARISSEMDKKKISNVNLIESALVPFQPVSPKTFLNLLLSIIFGIFGGVALAFFQEYIHNTIDIPSDVERYLQLPVFSSIPDFESRH